jgi:hypothetical protein
MTDIVALLKAAFCDEVDAQARALEGVEGLNKVTITLHINEGRIPRGAECDIGSSRRRAERIREYK